MLKEFKEFLMRGNIVELAVAVIIPIYENLLANDRENGEKALAQLPVKRRVMEDLHLHSIVLPYAVYFHRHFLFFLQEFSLLH